MTATNEITRVTYRWDDQPGVEPGWYCESWAGSRMIDDGQKIWFPVSVDEYTEAERSDLVAALREAFPAAEIVGQ